PPERAARALYPRALRSYLSMDPGVGAGPIGSHVREHRGQPGLAVVLIESRHSTEGKGIMKIGKLFALTAALGFSLAAATGFAQTIKIGFITSYSGLNGNLGPYMERGMRLYLKEHQKELPPGVT